jgi:hypothetical protein
MMIATIEQEILKDVLSNPGDTFYENVLSDFLDEQGIEHDFRNPLHNNFITELKPYQEKCLNIWKNHWIRVGLCTKPTNEDKAEQYFYNLYKEFGLKKPKSIIWIDNPIEMCRQVSNQISNQVWDQLWNQVSYQVSYQVNDQVRRQVWNHVWNQVWNHVWNQVRNHVWNQVRNQISSHSQWYRVWKGQQDAHFLACYSYCMQVLRIETPKPTVSFILLAQEVNWWFSTKQAVFATRKPKECIVEDGKLVKLVCQDGYTIQ